MANFPCSGHARGEADEPVRKPLVRAVFAVVRRQDGGSPCGGRGATALPPSDVGSVRGTSNIAICDVAMPHITPRRAGGESCVRWATSRSPAAGTLREGRKGCFCKKWIICAVRRIRQDEG